MEVGPGSGKFSKKFLLQNDNEIHLTEINEDLFKLLNDEFKDIKKNVKILSKKIDQIDDTYDTICYFDVIEHIEDHENEIKNALKKLSTNGNLIILVPALITFTLIMISQLDIIEDMRKNFSKHL